MPSKSYPVTIKAEQRPRSTKGNCCSWSSLFNYSIICNKRCFYNLLKIQLLLICFAHLKGWGWSIIYDSDCEGWEITTTKKTRKEVELEIELWGWRTEPHCEWKTPCRSPHMRHCAPNICAPRASSYPGHSSHSITPFKLNMAQPSLNLIGPWFATWTHSTFPEVSTIWYHTSLKEAGACFSKKYSLTSCPTVSWTVG